MSRTIYENGHVTARLFAGPVRAGADRRMVQINNGGAFVQVHPDDLAGIAAATVRALEVGNDKFTIAFCSKCDRWTMVCAPGSQNRAVWTKIAIEAGDRIAYVDPEDLDELMSDRGSCDGSCAE